MFSLVLLFVYGFLLSFSHFDHLACGRGSQSLCLSCICLLAMHTLICVTFSLSPRIRGWLRRLLVALPRLFCLPFYMTSKLFKVLSMTMGYFEINSHSIHLRF